VTQQNAANAEESASASEELSAQAESMNEIVGELVSLVRGSAGAARQAVGSKTERSAKPVGKSAASAKTAKEPAVRSHFGHSDETFHQIAGVSRKDRAQTKKGPKSAGHAIPLNEPDDLKDFNG